MGLRLKVSSVVLVLNGMVFLYKKISVYKIFGDGYYIFQGGAVNNSVCCLT